MKPASKTMAALPAPPVVSEPKEYLHQWSPPVAPATNQNGAAMNAAPVTGVPTGAHAAVFSNQATVTTIISYQQNEAQPNRYYWHHDGGYDYVHYYSGGAHWYGFYVGPNYYWSNYHYNRWWWYDPVAGRYLYFHGGYWWWQDPYQPMNVYVYMNGSYMPYSQAAAAASAPPPPPAPAVAPAPVPAPSTTTAVSPSTGPALTAPYDPDFDPPASAPGQ